jgi:hypothetical protein
MDGLGHASILVSVMNKQNFLESSTEVQCLCINNLSISHAQLSEIRQPFCYGPSRIAVANSNVVSTRTPYVGDIIGDAEEEVCLRYKRRKTKSRRVWAFIRNGRWWWYGWVYKVKHKYAFHGLSLV